MSSNYKSAVLQKYRLYLSRLQKESDPKSSSSGNKHSDLPPKDTAGSFGFQNSTNRQQNDVAVDSYKYSDVPLESQNAEAKSHESDLKGIVSEISTERRALSISIPDTKIRSSCVGLSHSSFAPLESEGSHTVFDCTIPTQYTWSEAPELQLKKEHKPLLQLEDSFSQLPLHVTQRHIQVDQSQSIASVSSNPSITEGELAACIDTKPLYADHRSDYASSVSSMGSAGDTFSIQSKSLVVNDQPSESISNKNVGMNKQGLNPSCISDLDIHPKNLLTGGEVVSAPLDEDYLQFCWLQSECYNMNLGLQNIDMPEYYDPGLVVEIPTHLYDSSDYSVVDQGLFIV